jgi:ATP adenylyltransferase
MKDMYARNDFKVFTNVLATNLMKEYGPLIAFEHGSNKEGSPTACGTNHAHLHLVPFAQSLFPEMLVTGLDWAHCKASEIAKETKGGEYLFYRDISLRLWDDSQGYLHVLERPRSQFFRQLIARKLGNPNLSDYRQFPNLETSVRTRKTLAGLSV